MAKIKKIHRENLHKVSGGSANINSTDRLEKNVPSAEAEKRRRRPHYSVDPMAGTRPRKPRTV